MECADTLPMMMGPGLPAAATATTATTTSSSSASAAALPAVGRAMRRLAGLLLLSAALFLSLRTPFHLLMELRLRMDPWLPAFRWWADPPDEVYLRFYVFNVTNAAAFSAGLAPRLALQEVGPIVFHEQLAHRDISWGEGGATLEYTVRRRRHFVREQSAVDLSAQVDVLNLVPLGLASYLHDAPFFLKLALNMLLRRTGSAPIRRVTLHDFLFNLTDPALSLMDSLAPALVPAHQIGLMPMLFSRDEQRVRVRVGNNGNGTGHRGYFTIVSIDGSETVPRQKACGALLNTSSEGVLYHQFISKRDALVFYREAICHPITVRYKSEARFAGLRAYQFGLDERYEANFANFENCGRGIPALHAGLVDTSCCYFNMPLASSFPHYLYGDAVLSANVTGLRPSAALHDTLLLVEPTSGVPLHSRARMQANLVVRNLSGFSADIQRYSNSILPLFWTELGQRGLPFNIAAFLYFNVNVVPVAQWLLVGAMLFYGLKHLVGLPAADSPATTAAERSKLLLTL